MGVRSYLGNKFIGFGRKLGRGAGYELAVEVSDHDITARMERPDKTERAWDEDLYKRGNMFVAGYANPIKPSVDYNRDLEDPDTVDVVEGDTDADSDGEDDTTEEDVQLIASPRYREYMQQDLISQILNPREQWRLLAYGIIALGILTMFNIALSLSASGLV